MPAYLLFALLAMALVGLADLVYKVAASRGVEAANFAVVQSWFFGATSLLIALATGAYQATSSILWGFAAGATVFASVYFFIRSLALGEALVCVPIYRVNFLVAGLLGVVFLGEILTARKLAGVASGALAIGLLADFPWRRLLPLRPRARSLPSTRVAGGGIARFDPFSGALLASGLIALTEGLRTGDASVVVPIAQMSLLVTVLLSSLFLGERLTRKRVAGLLLTLLAIFALGR